MASGGAAVTWGYLPNSGDRRLSSIDNYGMRQYTFTTTPEALVTAIGGSSPWGFSYDNGNRLTAATGPSGWSFSYGLDPAGNMTQFGYLG
jgi:YD repeat-containing protein